MAVSHVFSSPVANITGTVTVFDSSGSTKTEAASNIVQPQHWNSAHNQFMTIVGNTAGQSTLSGTNIYLAGGPNITLSANAGTVSISAGAGGAGDGVNIIAAGGSTANTTGTIQFDNGNGVSFGLNGATVTASHNGLTTAAASNHSHGNPSLALTNLTGTTASNSAGLTLSLSGNAAQSVQTQNMVSVLGSTGNISFVNSNGITFGGNASTITASHNGLTTAAASNHSHGASGQNGSFAFQTLSFSNANGLSFGTSAGSAITASHNGLTSQSNQAFSAPGGSSAFQTLTFANSNGVSWSNSNGSVVGSVATNYAASDHSHGNPSLALTNISGTTASNSAGLTLSLSAAGGGVINQTGPNISAGTQLATSGTVVFSNSNGITFGMSNSSVVTASHDGLTTAAASNHSHGNPSLNLTNLSGTTASNSAGFTLSLSAGAAGGAATVGGYEIFPLGNNTAFTTLGQNSVYLQRFVMPVNASFNNLEIRISGSTVSSSNSQVAAHTYNYGLYSLGTGASTSIYSRIATSQLVFTASFNSNTAAGYTISQGAASFTSSSAGTALMSALTGFKHLYLPFTSTLTADGHYAIALHMSSATTVGTSPLRIGIKQQTYYNNLTIGKIYATTVLATNASFVGDFALGVYSATSGGLADTIARSGLTNAASQGRLYVQLED